MDDVSRARARTLARILDAVAKEINEIIGQELKKAFPGGLSESLAAEDSAEDRDRLLEAADAASNAAATLDAIQPRPR